MVAPGIPAKSDDWPVFSISVHRQDACPTREEWTLGLRRGICKGPADKSPIHFRQRTISERPSLFTGNDQSARALSGLVPCFKMGFAV